MFFYVNFIQKMIISFYQFLKEKVIKTNIIVDDIQQNACVINGIQIISDIADMIDVNNDDDFSYSPTTTTDEIIELELINNNFQIQIPKQEQQQQLLSPLIIKKKYWPVSIKNQKPRLPEIPNENKVSNTTNSTVDLKMIETTQISSLSAIVAPTVTSQYWTPNQMIQKP